MVEINTEDKRWHKEIVDITYFLESISNAILFEGKSISFLLTNDEGIRIINRKFRNKDVATNVLAFPYEGFSDGFIGDIALSFDTIKKEAELLDVGFCYRAAEMTIHGVLHLLGYDHQSERDRMLMETIEDGVFNNIAKRLNLF